MKSEFLVRAFGGVDPKKIRNIGWMLFQQGTSLLAGFVLMIFLARHLGPDLLAVYAWIFSLVMLAFPLVTAFEALSTRRMVAEPEHGPRILAGDFSIRVAGALVGMLCVVALALVVRPASVPMPAVLLGVMLLPAMALFSFDVWFRAHERLAVVALPKSVAALLSLCLGLGLVQAGAGLFAFLALRVGQAVVSGVAAPVWYRLKGPYSPLSFSKDEPMRLLAEGWPLVLAGLTGMAHLRVDQIMLGSLAPMPQLADYALAARLVEVVTVLHVALQAAFYPSLVRAFSKAPDAFDRHMQRYYDLHALSGYLGAFALILAGLLFFVPIFGAVYSGGTVLVCVLALAVPAQLLVAARTGMLTIRGWTRTILIASALSLAVNITANAVLIPINGASGAAWATVASMWTTCMLLPLIVKGLRPAAPGILRALLPWDAVSRVRKLARAAEP